MTLRRCEIRSCCSVSCHFRFFQHFARIDRIEATPPPACKYMLSSKAFLTSAVVEDVELSASYLRVARCDERFEIFAVVT